MKPKEAFVYVQMYQENLTLENSYEDFSDYNKYSEALKIIDDIIAKRTTMKPIKGDLYYCPVCKSIVFMDFHFCPHKDCGQAIDWSDEKQGGDQR